MNFFSLPLIIKLQINKRKLQLPIRNTGLEKIDDLVSPFNFMGFLGTGGNRLTSSIDDSNIASIDFSDTKL